MVIVHYPIFMLYMVWLILDAGRWLPVSGSWPFVSGRRSLVSL